MSRCQILQSLSSSSSVTGSTLKLQEALTRLKFLAIEPSGSGLMVHPTLCQINQLVHVLEYHYAAPDGSDLTDDERISRRRPLKIYDSDTSVLDSSRKGKRTENGAKVSA